ncbi:putative macrophage migration inhibitory factor-like protein isoform X1 [Iris pallida]|uniref:Macrophage migration inhibitory factor-like protein isoform X1 n=1 Tax=Iris pallida TaxID=29817 RepID=A0AAX6EL63_IRIPA|nr:putative macrophage migration inhibitory factor-like protein isoform X1 [Iris pallida]
MPCLNLSTNVNLDGVDTSAILADATKTVAKLIGKPEAYVMIVLKGSVPIAFGGSEQPAAYGELVSIGGLTPEVNKKLSAGIAEILESKLSVPKSRFFLKFFDTKARYLYLQLVRPKTMLSVCMLYTRTRSVRTLGGMDLLSRSMHFCRLSGFYKCVKHCYAPLMGQSLIYVGILHTISTFMLPDLICQMVLSI